MTAILDPVADFAFAPITNTPLADTATSFEIADQAGDITTFKDPGAIGYYALAWPRDPTHPHPGDAYRAGLAEIVRVTSRNVPGQSLTVTRAQLGTSALNMNLTGATYWLMAGMNSDVIEKVDARLWDVVSGRLETDKESRIVIGGTPNAVTDAQLYVVNGASSGDDSKLTVQSGTAGTAALAIGTVSDGDVCQISYDANALLFSVAFTGTDVFTIPLTGRGVYRRFFDIIASGTAVTATDEVAQFVRSASPSNDATIGIQSGNTGSAGIRLGDSDSATQGSFILDNNTNDAVLQSNTGDLDLRAGSELLLRTAGALRARINATGLAIGNSSPTEELDVQGDAIFSGRLKLDRGADLTVAANAITVTHSSHRVVGTGSPTINTINGGEDGSLLVLKRTSAAGTVTVANNVGNIQCGGNRVLDRVAARMVLEYDADDTNWHMMSYENN